MQRNVTVTYQTLEGKTAVVTGAGRGMGRAQALLLASLGVKVLVNDLPTDKGNPAEDVVGEIVERGGEAVAFSHSVGSFEGGGRVVEAALDAFGGLDIVVNTAGTYSMGPLEDLSEEDWHRVLSVNLTGVYATIRRAIPVFREQGSGSIVNLSSDAGLGDYFSSVYCASKEGVVGLTRAVAREYGRWGVRCNAIRPRAFDTGMADRGSWERQRHFDTTYGMPMCGTHRYTPRMGTGDEVAAVVAWLCTDGAAHVNGRVIHAGCGELGLWSESTVARSVYQPGGLDPAVVAEASRYVLDGLEDAYAGLPEDAMELIDARLQRQAARDL